MEHPLLRGVKNSTKEPLSITLRLMDAQRHHVAHHSQDLSEAAMPQLDPSHGVEAAMSYRDRARHHLVKSFSDAIIPLHIDEVEKPFSFQIIHRLARGLQTDRWTPDTETVLAALRPTEVIDLISLMKDEKKRFELSEAFSLQAGLDPELFRKALGLRGFSAEHSTADRRRWTMDAYQVLRKLHSPLDQDAVREILGRHGRSESFTKNAQQQHFRVDWLYLRDRGDESDKVFPSGCASWAGFGGLYCEDAHAELKPYKTIPVETRSGEIYIDTPMGILLSHKGIPQAVLGCFLDDREPQCLYIKQIQGLVPLKPESEIGEASRYAIRGLPKLHWEKALVEIAEDVARSLQLHSVRIVSAENNPWSGHRNYSSQREFSNERALQRYNDTALELGYERTSSDGDFFKQL